MPTKRSKDEPSPKTLKLEAQKESLQLEACEIQTQAELIEQIAALKEQNKEARKALQKRMAELARGD